MKHTFRIKDEDGCEYQVEEIKEEKDIHDEESLSSEEISALKRLASVADKLIDLTDTKDEVDPDTKRSVNEVLEDEDEDEEKEDFEEKVVDTDEDEESGIHDSANALEKKSKTNDSVDVQSDIASAWAKRYGGNR